MSLKKINDKIFNVLEWCNKKITPVFQASVNGIGKTLYYVLVAMWAAAILAFLYWFFDVAKAVVWLKANPIVLAIILATTFLSIVIYTKK